MSRRAGRAKRNPGEGDSGSRGGAPRRAPRSGGAVGEASGVGPAGEGVGGGRGRRIGVGVAVLAAAVLVIAAGLWTATGGWRKQASRGSLGGRGEGFNVLLITLDTTRADCLGCYGHPVVKTPNMDALAREGVRFTQCTATAPITLPSHASIMTSTYPFVHRARSNGRYLADEGNVTLAELLKAAGYSTGAEVGAFVLDAAWGIDQGFDSYRSSKITEGGITRLERLAEEQSVPADDVCDRALEWLGQQGAQPFFLWVHFYDPHQPFRPPERFAAQYAGAPFGAYWGEIAFVDEQIGRLLAELKRLGLKDRTVIVLTTDHGEGLLQHKEMTHTYFVYDSTMRVPLIFWCPPRIRARQVFDCQVRTVDVTPTVLAFLGLPPKTDAQGASLLPLLEGKTRDLGLAAYGESVAAHDWYGYSRLRTYRADGWKYIHAPTPELFDVRNDPGENVNLAARYPEHVESMRSRLESLIAESMEQSAAPDRAMQLDSEAAARLAALGYVGGWAPPTSKDELRSFHEFEGPDPKDRVDSYNMFQDARALADADLPEKAEPILWRVVEREPNAPVVRDLLAGVLGALGRPEEAIEQYRVLVRLQPENALAHYNLGKMLGQVGRLTEGLEHLRVAVEAMPEDAYARKYLGLALLELGRPAEAEVEFREVLRFDPPNADARSELSGLLQRRGLWAEALAVLEEGLRLRPENATLANNLAWFRATAPLPELRDGVEAVRLAEETQQLVGHDDPSVLDTLAAAYAEAGRFDEAIATARQALELAESAESPELAAEIQARLALYESGQAYHQDAE